MDDSGRGRYSNLSTEEDEDAGENLEAGVEEEEGALHALPEGAAGLPREGSGGLAGGSAASGSAGVPLGPGSAAGPSEDPSALPPLPPGRRRRWWLAPVLLVAGPSVAFGAAGAWRLARGPGRACGGPGACARCELRPELPRWRWRCGVCSLGYHLAEGGCQANRCTCTGGSPALGEACPGDGRESCGACGFGYHQAGRLCLANLCRCHGGTPPGAGHCGEEGAERCGACDKGFHLKGSSCAWNRCTCREGTPATGAACDIDGAERCGRCDGGLHLVESFCQKNRCTCRHGSALTGAACSRDGAERCRACDPGFHMVTQNFTCAQNTCFCQRGSAVTGASCLADGVEQCGKCDLGYHLDSGLCAENFCTCRGGRAPRGVACAADGAWRCTSCRDGFHLMGKHCDPYVHVFDSGDLVREDRGAPDLLADLRHLGHIASPFTGSAEADWAPRRAGALVLPELQGPLELGEGARRGLGAWVRRGGHLVVCGDYFGHNGRFLNAMFGWSLQGVLSYGSSARGEGCGVFCEGPRSLEWNPGVSCYADGLLPAGARAVYRDGGSVCALTAELGSGRVTYLGFDWYNSTRQNWTRVLQLAVVSSG